MINRAIKDKNKIKNKNQLTSKLINLSDRKVFWIYYTKGSTSTAIK